MKIFKLERKQTLPISIEEAWDYFSNPLNLREITPPGLSLRIKGGVNRANTNGMLIEYTVKPLLGITMDWISEIKHVEKPYYFVDEQRSGPYKFWYHQHIFKAIGRHEVEITDLVHYALPLGPLAVFLNDHIVEDKLTGIFNFRKYVLEQKFNKEWVGHEQVAKSA